MSFDKISVSKNDIQYDVVPNPSTRWIWNEMNHNRWEEETFKIFDRFLTVEKSYIDIGAWIGPTVLYGANRAKHVFGIEPDPVAYHELIVNINLNPQLRKKITPINAAVAEKSGDIKLYKRHQFGDSTSSMLPTISDQFCYSRALAIDDLITQYKIEEINFIKMDVEGGEYSLISFLEPYLKMNQPTLYLSIHPGFLIEHNKLTLSEAESLEKTKIITEEMLDHLSFYKNIYDIDGNLVTKDTILKINKTGEFVFTNETW